MKILMTATALTALVAASSAFGQAQDPAQDPLMESPPAASQPAPDAKSPDAMTPSPDAGSAGQAAAPSDMFIERQDPNDVLASSLIGSSVENTSNENLGTISDVVMSEDGSVDAVVIGVGGFLGIGQKNIAVPYDRINKTTDADGNATLVLDTTREELDAAPSFVTQEGQQQDMQQPAAPSGSTPPQ